MGWKNVFDNENLLSPKEYKLAEKFVEKDDRTKNLFFKRNMVYSTEKYDICSGVSCLIDWDEFCNFTIPQKCFFIIDKDSNKVVAFTEKLDKNKDNIVSVLKTPFKLKDVVCPDVKNINGIYNVKKESIIPVKTDLHYDKQGNIFTLETIYVTKQTYYKDGAAQSPIYSGHEEIVK